MTIPAKVLDGHHVMHFGALRNPDPVCDGANGLQNLDHRPRGSQLVGTAECAGVDEESPIPRNEDQGRVSGVEMFLLKGLGTSHSGGSQGATLAEVISEGLSVSGNIVQKGKCLVAEEAGGVGVKQ